MYRLLLKIFVYPLSLLPMWWLYFCSDINYFLVYKVFKYRRKVVFQNLSRSFPQKNDNEIKQLAKGFYKHFCDIFVEMLKFYSIRRKNLQKRMSFTNIELLNDLYAAEKNVILMMGHYGNWELSILPTCVKAPVGAVYSPLENKLSDLLMKQMRTRFGVEMFPMKRIGKHILTHSTDARIYMFVADQSPSAQTKFKVEFLNQPTLFFTGAEKLAKVTQSAMVFLQTEKLRRGYYRFSFITITENAAEQPEGFATQRFAELLEENINQQPTYWLWSHKRWKRKA